MLQSKWFRSCKTEEERDDLEKVVRNSSYLFDRILEIVDAEIREAEATPVGDYESPGWAYKRADKDGQLRALKRMRLLFDLTNERK